uniref:RING-type domain-containing protein n=1 Tax=Panagrolaimus sp. ES5 TaxID=591445 RepID=A0AC34G646_9BILA
MFNCNKLFGRLVPTLSQNIYHKSEALSNLFKRFKKENDYQFHQCIICCEYNLSKKFIQCQSNHPICQKCLQQLAKTHIYSLHYNTIIKGYPCPNYECEDHLSYETCSKFLTKKDKLHIQSKIHEAMLMNAEIKFDKCQKCGTLAEILDKKIFKCPNCFYKFCYNCNKKCTCSHDFDKCVKTVQKRNDVLSEALIHKCHNCSLPFIKKGGKYEACNQMDCPCGASQCYACREPIYGHLAHRCVRQKQRAHEIHERDIETAKRRYFLKNLL